MDYTETIPIIRAPRTPSVNRATRKDKLPGTQWRRTIETRRFIGWDGEGYTTPDGEHHFALFGNSDGLRVTGDSLTFQQCLPLLFRAPKDAIHVIFAGTYDVTMMFRDCREHRSIMAAKWVTIGQYQIRFLKGKSLLVKCKRTKQTRTLYDVFSFFGTSFVNACREYLPGNDELLAEVAAMKLQRAGFASITPEIEAYMTSELQLLVQLCDSLRERLNAVNIFPSRWHGPGAVAGAVLKAQNVNVHRNRNADTALVRAAESAYYGGRFEMFRRGTYLGPVYQYDIRSAYPYAMTKLPDISGEWLHRTNVKVKHDYALYYVRKQHSHTPAVPHRNHRGNIVYPEHVNGWYWGVELPTGQNAIQSWLPPADDGTRPFSFVSEMYQERAALRAAGKPEQLALKLALNSLYGKLAQSKGAAWNGKQWAKPAYHETLWAGYITAYTRAMLQHAMALAGPDLIALETDAIFTTKPLNLFCGPNLGDWDCTEYDGIKYLQSGVHMTLTDGVWSMKTRGLSSSATTADALNELLATKSVGFKQTRFGTDTRQPTFGKWYTQTRMMTLDRPDSQEKRTSVGPCVDCVGPDVDYTTHLHRLALNDYSPWPPLPSVPYSFVWNDDPNPFDNSDPLLLTEFLPKGNT